MATQATLASAFTKAAIRFNVAESDYLLLGSMGVANFESLAYRIPKSEDLEEMMKVSIAPYAAFKGDDEVVQTFNREPPMAWGEYKLSEDAAALRKLWAMSREVCKAEIESLASGDSSTSKQKVGVANSIAMEKDAILAGMVVMLRGHHCTP